ncbi:hypothetical protein ACU8DI_01600 [Psychroserpens sp. BH13MA-6]
MKNVKTLFSLLLAVFLMTSCTNTDLDEDYEPTNVENVQATGDEQDVDDGTGKD